MVASSGGPQQALLDVAQDPATVVGLHFGQRSLQLLDEVQQSGWVGLQQVGAPPPVVVQLQLQVKHGLHLLSQRPAGQLRGDTWR